MPQLLNKITVIAALAGAAIAGCGGNSGPGGKLGAPIEPTTLTLGDANHGTGTPAVMDFVRDVARDSHGGLQVKLVAAPETPSDYEVRIVHDTAAGRWNLAWVGTRVLDEVGVPDAGALQVPFLLDSYALEGAVVNGPIGAQLTREISHARVVGIGLLADQLRYLATAGPVTSPASLVGKRMGAFDSASQFAGWRALHATPVLEDEVTASAVALMHDGRLFGIAADPSTYASQNGIPGTMYTVGVPIWPRPVAIIAAPRWFASLRDSTRSLLRLAAKQASAQSVSDAPGTDAAGITTMCRSLHVVALDPAERAAFIATGKAVAAELARTEPYGALISEIERLKGSAAPEPTPPIPAACGASSTAGAPTGPAAVRVARELAYALRPGTVYRAMTSFAITKQQLGLQQADYNAGTYTWRFLSGNRFTFTGRPQFPAQAGPIGPPVMGTFKIHADLLDVTFNPPYDGSEVDRCSVSGTSVTCRWLSGNDDWTTKFGLGGMTTPLTLVHG
jgi:TRAP-type C4-dicarboxylate transport system substrate-binding protein